MFNFIHNILSKFYFTKPSVNYIQPKSLNVKFNSSKDPQYFWINLQNVSSMQPFIEQIKEDNNNSFMLSLSMSYKNGTFETLSVAQFETRSEAQNALNVLTSKMNGPEKSIVKFSLVVLILAFVWGLSIDIFVAGGQNLNMARQANSQNAQNSQRSPSLSANEQAALIKELTKQAPQNLPQAQPQQPNSNPNPNPPVQAPPNPVDSLLEGLGK